MGLGGGPVRFFCDLWQRGIFESIDSVCESGSQELNMTAKEFHGIVQAHGLSDYDRQDFALLDKFPGTPRESARKLYQLLGAQNYTCLDLNKEHGAIGHDLNTPFDDRSKWEQFDLVTDFGCNEHCFNVMEAYRTLHRLLKPGGYMVICQPRYAETNGYYLMDESFYEGLAAANGYKIVQAQYVTTELNRAREEREQFLIPLSRDLLRIIDLNAVKISIIYCLQKVSSEDFVIPYQDKFLSERQGNAGYIQYFERRPPVRSYLPIESAEGVVNWALQTHREYIIREILTKHPEELKAAIDRIGQQA